MRDLMLHERIQLPRRASFRRPLPQMLPGLISGAYEGVRIPLHTYEACQIVLPLTRFVVLSGGAAIPTGPGDIWLSNMLELLGATAAEALCQARFFLVSPDLAQDLATVLPPGGSRGITDPAIAYRLLELWNDLEQPADPAASAMSIKTALGEVTGRCRGDDSPPSATRMDGVVRRTLDHLRRHVEEPQALQDLAELSGVSKSYLVREFHRVVGLPPHAYHLQLRIARAARLLASGMSLSRVAFEAGFADQSHLSRRFKAAYGITPLVFARSVRSVTPIPFDGAGLEVA